MPTKKEDIVAPEMKEIFKNNLGITGKVFPDSHPYFDVLPAHILAAGMLRGLAMPDKEGKKSVDLQTQKNTEIVNLIHKGKNGGFVKVSSLADPSDYNQNLEAAKILADNGYSVMINRHFKKSDPEYGKNAEYTINGTRSDLKTPSKLTSIGTGFNNAQKQKLTELVSRLTLNFSYQNIVDGVDKGFTYNSEIQKVIFIKGKKSIEIAREEWVLGKHFEKIKKLS